MSAGTVEQTTEQQRRWTTGRLLATLAVVGMVAMWGYVIYLALGPGRQDPPDRLDDPGFGAAAQIRCSAALDAVDDLPDAIQATDPLDRADVVEQANDELTAMVDDLTQLAPSGEDGELVAKWLADWRTYLVDRADYVDALRTEEDPRLLVSTRDNDQITKFIDAFAADNDMPACGTPIDV